MKTVLTKEDVHNANDGRRFLERNLLLCPAGEPPTITSLSYCLHQVSEMKNIKPPIANAVRAVAYMMEEMEENAVNELVRDAVISQTNELAQDMKCLVEDAKEKIGDHIKTVLNQLTTLIPAPVAPSPETSPDSQTTPPSQHTYADALINPPTHANPRLAAREGIRARQIMLEGIDQSSKIGTMNGLELKVEFNKIMEGLGYEGKGIRLVTNLGNRGTLIEMENDHALNWLKKTENSFAFRVEIGPDVMVKQRTHPIIAFNTPLTFDPGNPDHIAEFREVNNVDQDTNLTLRWLKPPLRRTQEQKTAHLLLTFTEATGANRAISEGLLICGRRVRVEKTKKEPTRCLKCQGWNHLARECTTTTDKCGNCAKDHRTDQCPNPDCYLCASCNSSSHASWSRKCPTYLKKVDECDARNPENALQFFPTKEPWTWSKKDPPKA